MSDTFIRFGVEDGIATLAIDRPAKKNALTGAMVDDLNQAWRRVADDPAIRVAILTSQSDDVFTSGADLNDPPPRFWTAVPNVGVPTGKPIIAAVSGLVIGAGVTMVAMCDLCVAAESTRFIYPEAKAGIGLGLIASVAARIPHKIAMELMLTGEPITAQRAYDVGFVNRIVAAGMHRAAAMEMARGLAANAPLVMAMLKQFAHETIPRGPVERMYAAQRVVDVVMTSRDAEEGPRAFREKRKPKFEGR